MTRASLWSIVVILLGPGVACAQTVVNSFEELRRHLNVGARVTVVDEVGASTQGKIVEIAPASFAVVTDAEERRSFAAGPLSASIGKGDGLGNGIVLGLMAGLATAPALCHGAFGGCDQLTRAAAMSITVPAGIAAGLIVDALHVDREIRVTYSRNPPVVFDARPLVGSGARGLVLVLRW